MLQITIEFCAICLLLYGYTREQDIAKWERKQLAKIARLMSSKRTKPSPH